MQKFPYNATDNGLTVSTVSLNYETCFCHVIKRMKMEMPLGKGHFECQCTLKETQSPNVFQSEKFSVQVSAAPRLTVSL